MYKKDVLLRTSAGVGNDVFLYNGAFTTADAYLKSVLGVNANDVFLFRQRYDTADQAAPPSGDVVANLTASIGAITLASDVDIIVGATLTSSVGSITLASDVDVIVGATLTSSIGAITLSGDADIVVGASLTASIGDITLTADVTIAAGDTVALDPGTKQKPWLYEVRPAELPQERVAAAAKRRKSVAKIAAETDDEEAIWLLAA